MRMEGQKEEVEVAIKTLKSLTGEIICFPPLKLNHDPNMEYHFQIPLSKEMPELYINA